MFRTVLLAVGGDSLLVGSNEGPPAWFLVIGAFWLFALVFLLISGVLRWYAPPALREARGAWATIGAVVVAMAASILSATQERGWFAGLWLLLGCLVASAVIPPVLGVLYVVRRWGIRDPARAMHRKAPVDDRLDA